ncbi:kinase-like domain-containing protein [Mycena vitilis]|nr:kinase-like domain-containing protein [Mycena vitilis]
MPHHSATLPDLTGEFVDGGALLLLHLLGSGSYGKVYKAIDTTSPADNPTYYAVKCMHRYKPGSREEKMQLNELAIHGMLDDHPRVITMHRIFTSDYFVFVVLELCAGGDLFSAIADQQVFRGNAALVKSVLGELLDAVEFCHRNSVFHRDIKPENILCSPEGTDIRLADFGLATQVNVSAQFGCGSRRYMSPESIDREFTSGCYSARQSDLWAVSVIFATMISGHAPWSSAVITDPGFTAFLDDDDIMLKTLRLTRPTNALLKRCFDLEPRNRPTLPEFRAAVNKIDTFSVEKVVRRAPPAPAPVPRVPVSISHSLALEWRVASPVPAAEDCPTPRPACPPIYAPRPVRPTAHANPFTLGSTSAFSFSSSIVVHLASASSPSSSSPCPAPSSLPTSLPSSGPSIPSLATAAESSTPATPATRPAMLPVSVPLKSIPSPVDSVSLLPALPPRAYIPHVHARMPAPVAVKPIAIPAPSHTVASNARPTLPTRRQFLAGRGRQIAEK